MLYEEKQHLEFDMTLIAPVTPYTVQITAVQGVSADLFATIAKVSLIVAVFGLLILVLTKALEKNRIREVLNNENENRLRALAKAVLDVTQVAVPVIVAFSTQSTVPCISAVVLVGNYLLS
jgi:hypothetical protein